MTEVEPQKPSRNRRRRANLTAGRRHLVPEVARYVVVIEDWDWSLSLGVNDPGSHTEPFSDYWHIEIRGSLARAEHLKVSAVELANIATRHQTQP
jgi:hypothetical protein